MGYLATTEVKWCGVHGLLQQDQEVTGFEYSVGEFFHLFVWISFGDLLFEEVLKGVKVFPHDKGEVNELL